MQDYSCNTLRLLTELEILRENQVGLEKFNPLKVLNETFFKVITFDDCLIRNSDSLDISDLTIQNKQFRKFGNSNFRMMRKNKVSC